MDSFESRRATDRIAEPEVTRINIVALDVPYVELLKFCFKFILAYLPVLLVIYVLFFILGTACFGGLGMLS